MTDTSAENKGQRSSVGSVARVETATVAVIFRGDRYLVVMCVYMCCVFVCSYFRDYLSIVFEFFPMVFFLLALFGYMDVLIIGKWIVVDASMSRCAPSILMCQYQLHDTTNANIISITWCCAKSKPIVACTTVNV